MECARRWFHCIGFESWICYRAFFLYGCQNSGKRENERRKWVRGRGRDEQWQELLSLLLGLFFHMHEHITNCSFSIYDLTVSHIEFERESERERDRESEMKEWTLNMCKHPSGMKTTYHFFRCCCFCCCLCRHCCCFPFEQHGNASVLLEARMV